MVNVIRSHAFPSKPQEVRRNKLEHHRYVSVDALLTVDTSRPSHSSIVRNSKEEARRAARQAPSAPAPSSRSHKQAGTRQLEGLGAGCCRVPHDRISIRLPVVTITRDRRRRSFTILSVHNPSQCHDHVFFLLPQHGSRWTGARGASSLISRTALLGGGSRVAWWLVLALGQVRAALLERIAMPVLHLSLMLQLLLL